MRLVLLLGMVLMLAAPSGAAAEDKCDPLIDFVQWARCCVMSVPCKVIPPLPLDPRPEVAS